MTKGAKIVFNDNIAGPGDADHKDDSAWFR